MSKQHDFGLGDLSEALSDFRPSAAQRPDPQTARRLETVGAEEGFIPREAITPIRVKRADPGPTTALFIRLSVPEFNRFVRLSQDARKGRADFLVDLMDAYEKG